ncbi:hypothetical protein Sjap_022984 [Stephania japonica]|uniref:F-box protein At3g26010-like beta-propeller domain-containing protein n=1 Tax=Stephania japonica TaxID=461633 RepID=A0AAP0EVB7_9MAGN
MLSFSVTGSSDGLLYGYGVLIYNDLRKKFVCNPVTKQLVLTPIPKFRDQLKNSLALAFDPNHPKFGFSLIQPYIHDVRNCYRFEVYSSKTGEWNLSSVEVLVPYQDLLKVKGNVYTKEKVYWSLGRYILWFDVEENVAGFLPCPSDRHPFFCQHSPVHEDYYLEIGVYKGDLSYSGITKGGIIQIWLLRSKEGENEMWEMKHKARLTEIIRKHWDVMSFFCKTMEIKSQSRKVIAQTFSRGEAVYPLPYVGGEVLWFWRRIEYHCGNLFSFNLTTRDLKLAIVDDVWLPVYPFTPSLQPCPT